MRYNINLKNNLITLQEENHNLKGKQNIREKSEFETKNIRERSRVVYYILKINKRDEAVN